jgi:hypothetical protein
MARTTTAVFRRKQTETPKRPFSRRVSHCATYTTAMVVRYELYQLRFIDRASVIPLMPSCCIYACVPRILEDRHTNAYYMEVARCQSRQQLLCAVLTAYQKQRLGGGC